MLTIKKQKPNLTHCPKGVVMIKCGKMWLFRATIVPETIYLICVI